MDYADFQTYMHHLKELQERDGSKFPIRWDHIDIDSIQAEDHANIAGLQIADVIASSFLKAVEPNPYGGYEQRYARQLQPNICRSADGHYLNYGIKPASSPHLMALDEEQEAFFEFWRKERQAPGP